LDQERLLGDKRNGLAQQVKSDFSDVDAINLDATFANFTQPEEHL